MSTTLTAAYPERQTLAFPLRMQQAQFLKTNERESYSTILWMMARTERGTWPGHLQFGFREFFTEIVREGLSDETRMRLIESVVTEVNRVLVDLGLTRYVVDSLVIECPPKDLQGTDRLRWLSQTKEGNGAILTLCEQESGHRTVYSL